MRSPLITLAVLVGLAVVLGAFRMGNREAIAEAQAEAARLTAQRDSLTIVIDAHEAAREVLSRERRAAESVIGTLRDSVSGLERDRAETQLRVRQIRTTGALMDRFRATFPALGDSVAGLTTVPLDSDTLGLEYLMVPAWFAETFIIDHANAASWREQRDGLLLVDSLRASVTRLQDSITRLAQAERDAYRTGYDAALHAYGALNTRHLAELRKPRVQVGSVVSFLLGVGTALTVATLVQ